jgi:ubiquinone/menaquinone biosynthesis C-methylase UbiE
MLRYVRIAGVCVAMMSPGCSGHGDPHERTNHHAHDATVQHRFEDADQWAKHFDAPERDTWQRPERVLAALGIQAGQSVADIGAGTGYFTVRISPVVGRTGRVLAVDVEPSMVEHIRRRATESGLDNVEAILARASEPELAPASVDLVFICDTWHHIDDRLRYLDELRTVLRPGGRVAIVDFKPGALPVGPPKGHKLSSETVIAEFGQAGWKLSGDLDVLPYQYILVFEP